MCHHWPGNVDRMVSPTDMAVFSEVYSLVEEADNKQKFSIYLYTCYKVYKRETQGGDRWMEESMDG